MLPSPLHPALVHFPIALMVFLPLVALVGLLVIHRGFPIRRSWAVVVAFQALLVFSGVVALKTGQQEEERVEKVVAESLIGEHEEAAEDFLWVAALVLVVAAAGLLSGTAGTVGRLVGGRNPGRAWTGGTTGGHRRGTGLPPRRGPSLCFGGCGSRTGGRGAGGSRQKGRRR